MPIFAPLVPIRRKDAPGYSPGQPTPIDGATPLGVSAQEINDHPELFNQWLHAQPWYLAALKAWGLDPNDPHLGIQHRAQLAQAAARAGVDTSGGNGAFGIDSSGNFEDTSMPTWDKIALSGFGGAAAASALGLLGGAGTAGGAGSGGAAGAAGGTGAAGAAGGAGAAGAAGLTGGADLGASLLKDLVIPGVGSFLSGLGQSMFQQQRHSFTDVDGADPREIFPQIGDGLKGLLSGLQDQQKAGVSLPDATVQSPPTFAGGGMAMPIGLTGKDPGLGSTPSLSGGIIRRSAALPSSTQGSPDDKTRALAALKVLGV